MVLYHSQSISRGFLSAAVADIVVAAGRWWKILKSIGRIGRFYSLRSVTSNFAQLCPTRPIRTGLVRVCLHSSRPNFVALNYRADLNHREEQATNLVTYRWRLRIPLLLTRGSPDFFKNLVSTLTEFLDPDFHV